MSGSLKKFLQKEKQTLLYIEYLSLKEDVLESFLGSIDRPKAYLETSRRAKSH